MENIYKAIIFILIPIAIALNLTEQDLLATIVTVVIFIFIAIFIIEQIDSDLNGK